MSHHLTPEKRLDVHQAHVQKDGGYSSRPLSFEVPEIETDGSQQIGILATIVMEYCSTCGLFSTVGCEHGHMIWTHREGCLNQTLTPDHPHSRPQVALPKGLVKTYAETFPDHTVEERKNCEGCLLICPVCGADGT